MDTLRIYRLNIFFPSYPDRFSVHMSHFLKIRYHAFNFISTYHTVPGIFAFL